MITRVLVWRGKLEASVGGDGEGEVIGIGNGIGTQAPPMMSTFWEEILRFGVQPSLVGDGPGYHDTLMG